MSPPKRHVPLIAGNWKMHKTLGEARALTSEIIATLGDLRGVDVGLFPSATALAAVGEIANAADRSVLVGAQNMHDEPQGAFTGETSAAMILGCGASSVLLGHSERRHVFGESDELVGRKVRAALDAGLRPILCVGETIEEREADQTTTVCKRQLDVAISGISSASELAEIIIAYEPVWAIGTGHTATPEQAQEVHGFLRGELGGAFESRGGTTDDRQGTRILYGGSVKPGNAGELLAEADIDGALVGGASLDAESFVGICCGCTG